MSDVRLVYHLGVFSNEIFIHAVFKAYYKMSTVELVWLRKKPHFSAATLQRAEMPEAFPMELLKAQ